MNSLGLITLVTLSVVLSSSAMYYRTASPITMCMKSDYTWCSDVPYPTNCVNLDTVYMNNSGRRNNYGYMTAFRNIESVIVTDLDSTEDKCIVFYDTFNCQGRSLVLNGTKHPSADLNDFKFSNSAVSFRQCTDRSLTWLRYNKVNN